MFGCHVGLVNARQLFDQALITGLTSYLILSFDLVMQLLTHVSNLESL